MSRPSPALVVALTALFVALGGNSWAASRLSGTLIKAKTLSGKALKTHTVTGVKIAAKTLTAAKIADNTLTGSQLLESSLGTVPSAQQADNASTAVSAGTAKTAKAADTAKSADRAKTADTATNATNAVNATNALNATNAANANALGGVGPSGYMLTGTRTYTAGGNKADFADTDDLVTLAVPAGQYAVAAKIDIANHEGDGTADNLTCTLRRDGTAIDTTSFTLGPQTGGQAQTAAELPVPFVGTASGAASLTIRCTDGDDDASNGHIVAVRVN